MKEHEPIVLENFNGLWQKGDSYRVPNDHFDDGENFDFVGSGSIKSRDGVGKHQTQASPLGQVVRQYNYVTQDKNTLIVLTYDGTTGRIYHVVDSVTVHGPILTITGMKDFGFIPYAGRAYITPFSSFTSGLYTIEKGLQNEFLYVYKGDGTAARKASGPLPAGTITATLGAAGYTDPGFKIFAVVGETDTGFLSAPVAFDTLTTAALNSVSFNTVPVFIGAQWVKRHIVSSKNIIDYNGNTTGYLLYYIPNGTINDNTSSGINNVSFFDVDLLEEASHLLDNYTEIPAGVGLAIYHNRLVIYTSYTDISLLLVSAVGEPEAFSQVDGLLVFPPDGNPITNAAELGDILYVTKKSKTVSFIDNDDVPSTWTMKTVDPGHGASVHGIAMTIDSGSSTVDFLIIANYTGIMIFNGKFLIPELSWKISKLWKDLDKQNYRLIQLVNDTVLQRLYCVLPDYRLLVGDYTNGLEPKGIRWTMWRFEMKINTIALINTNELIMGSEGRRLT